LFNGAALLFRLQLYTFPMRRALTLQDSAIINELLSRARVTVANALISIALTLSTTTGVSAESAENPIFPANARPQLVFERTAKLNSGLTEGPAAAPDGTIYFTDMPLGVADQTMIHRYDPASNCTELFTSFAGKANGLAFDQEGHLIACDGAEGGGRCISRWDTKSAKSEVIAAHFQGHRLNSPNDMALDRVGRVYFSDPRYLGDEPLELEHQAVYRVELDGRVIEITHDVEKPNGIALSPDGKTLYVGDHNDGGNPRLGDGSPLKRRVMRLYAFPLDADGFVDGPKRTLVNFGAENGCDGIDVDEAGHIYIACRSLARPGIMVIDESGRQLAFLATGPKNQAGDFDELRGIPSNVEFGTGDDAHSLYITIDKGLYRVRTKQRGTTPVWSSAPQTSRNESR
jgi:gluconolactonase